MTESNDPHTEEGAPTGTPPSHGADPSPTTDDRPLGVHLLIWLYWFLTGAVTLAILTLVFGQGPVPMAGETVTRARALERILPVLVPLGLAVLGAALALQLRVRRARPAVLLPVALAIFGPALTGVGTTGDMVGGALVLVPLLALLAWYLYGVDGVREYFRGSRPL